MSTLTPPDATVATDAQFHGYEAARHIETMARDLRHLAAEMEERATLLLRGDGRAVYRAGRILSETMAGTAATSSRLTGMVDAAGKADQAWAAAQRGEGSR